MEPEVSSNATITPMRRRPGRAVPGVVLQIESLKTLWVLSQDILDLSSELERSDIREVALELCDRLAEHLAEYEARMTDERSESARTA